MKLFRSVVGLALLAAFAVVAAGTPAAATTAPIRIMIVGDSITQGSAGDFTWRYRLARQLSASGVSFSFVGPRTDLFDNVANTWNDNHDYADANFDQHHDAIWGRSLQNAAAGIQSEMSAAGPDYLLVLLGINDLTWGISDPAGTEASLRSFIANARAANPAERFIFAKLLPNSGRLTNATYDATVNDYNNRLVDTAAALSTAQSPIVVTDAGQDIVPATDLWDGTHPDAAGEVKIAAGFADTLAADFGIGAAYPRPYPAVPLGPQTAPTLSVTGGRQLTWTPAPGATGYYVYTRDVSAGETSFTRPPTPVTGTSWSFSGVALGADYQFKVGATKGSIEGVGSNTVSATVTGSAATDKGLIGWDAYRHLDQMPYLSSLAATQQFSSFDRTGGNADYGNHLADNADGSVIAQRQGAGEIESLWFTADWGADVTPIGKIKIILDGQTVLDAPLQDVVNGALGAPFSYPLVANDAQNSGGVYIGVPMPFRTSMIVTTQNNPVYYHVTIRTFADASGVPTFDPSDKATDVISMLQSSGIRDPKPPAPGSITARGDFTIAPGQSVTLAQSTGSGAVSGVQLRLPHLQHPSATLIGDDGRAFNSCGYSQFVVSVNPTATATRLTRRYDAGIGDQRSNVVVNGWPVGEWTPRPAAPYTWADETIDIPTSLTSGRSQLTVANGFISSDLDINEFGYYVDQLIGGVWQRVDTLDVGPDHTATEAAHQYFILCQSWAGRRSYSYPLPGQVTDTGRAFGPGGSSTFTIAVDPANTGVRLTRRFDPAIGHQQAAVSVNGSAAGNWRPDPASPPGRWADESIELPASLTGGRSQLTITNTFTSSDLDVGEFTYWADSHVAGGLARTDTVDVGDAGSEAAHGYRIAGQTWSGTRAYTYPPDDTALADLRIRITFDGTQTVDSPLGEFFGSARGAFDTRALMTALDTRPGGWASSWWPMPYGQSVKVELYNSGTSTVDGGEFAITSAPASHWATDLSGGAAGYFRATSRSGATTAGSDWTFLSTSGHGKVVGVVQGMMGPTTRFHLEGDERAYVDGSRTPQIQGTGTEDFYLSGFYFVNGVYTGPLTGETAHEADGVGDCPASIDCTGAYRLFVDDAIGFDTAVNFGIEHGQVDDVAATYSSTTFWYGQSSGVLTQTDSLTVGNSTSESAHGYRSGGSVTPLTSDFEGNDSTAVNVTADTRASTGAVTFTMAVNPANAGVLLQRTSDQGIGYQQVAVSVNGVAVGQWSQPLANTTHRWLDDSFPLPASVTAGRSSLAVTLTPVAGSPAWSAASYRAVTVAGPLPPPGPIAYVGRVASTASATTGTSVTIPVTRAVTAGDTLVVSVLLTNTRSGTVSVTDGKGDPFAVVTDVGDTGGDRTVTLVGSGVHALATSDSITVTFPSTGERHVAVDEFSGVSTVDKTASASAVTGGFSAGPTPTTSAPDELVFGVAGVEGGAAPVWATGFTALPALAVSSDRLAPAYRIVHGTGTFTASGSASAEWMASVVTMR